MVNISLVNISLELMVHLCEGQPILPISPRQVGVEELGAQDFNHKFDKA
jgi:hypothetical protein